MRNDCLRFYSQIRICLDGLWVTRGPRSPIIAPLGGRIYVRSIREKACNESAKLSHDGRDILWYSTLISRRNFRLVKWNRVSPSRGETTRVFFPLYIEISNDSSFSEFLIRQISQTFLTWRLLIDLTLNLTFRRIISPNIVALPSPIFHSSTILRKLAGRIRWTRATFITNGPMKLGQIYQIFFFTAFPLSYPFILRPNSS